jgi:hypothetical protein
MMIDIFIRFDKLTRGVIKTSSSKPLSNFSKFITKSGLNISAVKIAAMISSTTNATSKLITGMVLMKTRKLGI